MTSPNSSLLASTSPDVLMNKGWPVQFVQTKADGSGIYQAHPKGLLSTHHIHIDNEKMAAFEDRWGTLEQWEKQLNEKVVRNLAATIAIVMSWPEPRALKAMRTGGLTEYRMAVMGAYQQALGGDPKDLKERVISAAGDPEAVSTTTDSASDSWETTGESTGPSSGAVGWEMDTTPTDSGESASDSSSQPSSQWL